MATDRPSRTGKPWQRRWIWNNREITPRWLLVGHTGTPQYPNEDAVALCADIDGLFGGPPPRPRERFTLLGCVPEGARLGSRQPDRRDRWRRAGMPGQPVGVGEARFLLSGPDDTRCGVCDDVTGVFRDPVEPPVSHVALLGCRPEPPLLAAIAAIPRSTKAGLRRRRVSTQVGAVAADGSVVPLVNVIVSGTVVSSVPSPVGGDLLDVTIATVAGEPRPAGTRDILDLWFAGRPTERNLWVGYDRTLRHEWAGVALAHHRLDASDQPTGTEFDLDGRTVTDVEGFYCAMGEAINGPGGYFGWNLDALDECLNGKWGARTPFRLVWHESAVARQHLVTGYDRHRCAPAVTLDHLLKVLTAHGVDVELR